MTRYVKNDGVTKCIAARAYAAGIEQRKAHTVFLSPPPCGVRNVNGGPNYATTLRAHSRRVGSERC